MVEGNTLRGSSIRTNESVHASDEVVDASRDVPNGRGAALPHHILYFLRSSRRRCPAACEVDFAMLRLAFRNP